MTIYTKVECQYTGKMITGTVRCKPFLHLKIPDQLVRNIFDSLRAAYENAGTHFPYEPYYSSVGAHVALMNHSEGNMEFLFPPLKIPMVCENIKEHSIPLSPTVEKILIFTISSDFPLVSYRKVLGLPELVNPLHCMIALQPKRPILDDRTPEHSSDDSASEESSSDDIDSEIISLLEKCCESSEETDSEYIFTPEEELELALRERLNI